MPDKPTWRRLLRGAGNPSEVSGALDALALENGRSPQAVPSADTKTRAPLERALALHAWRVTEALNLECEDLRFAELARAFKSPAFFKILLHRSRVEGRSDRSRGIAVAQLALTSLKPLTWEMSAPEHGHLQARGWAALANARALAWDLDLAEADFARAEKLLGAFEPAPAAVRSEVLYLKSCPIIALDVASLLCRQHRLDEAVGVLREALVLLETLRLDAETLAAVNMLREALAGKKLAMSVVHRLRDRLAEVFQAPTI